MVGVGCEVRDAQPVSSAGFGMFEQRAKAGFHQGNQAGFIRNVALDVVF